VVHTIGAVADAPIYRSASAPGVLSAGGRAAGRVPISHNTIIVVTITAPSMSLPASDP